MNKPLSVAREDFLRALVSVINDSGLPPFIALEVLKGITGEVELRAMEQYRKDLAEWQASQEKEEEQDNG